MKFRKKPVVIEAMQFDGTVESRLAIAEWAHHGYPLDANAIIKQGYGTTLVIRTLEGDMTGCPQDWIIKGVKGEFYPCKSDIFSMTYEAVE